MLATAEQAALDAELVLPGAFAALSEQPQLLLKVHSVFVQPNILRIYFRQSELFLSFYIHPNLSTT